jgi:hypothetical protein
VARKARQKPDRRFNPGKVLNILGLYRLGFMREKKPIFRDGSQMRKRLFGEMADDSFLFQQVCFL